MEEGVSWSAYATAYDLMAENNPAYQKLLDDFRDVIRGWTIQPGSTILDVGAGTGNFSLLAAEAFPECTVSHVDADEAMIEHAHRKADAKGVSNIRFVRQKIGPDSYSPASVSAIICVHALYAIPQPQRLISAFFDWLEPEGKLYVCDVGRVLNITDWSRYLFYELYRQHGFFKTLNLFWKGRAVSKENRAIRKAQQSGEYWTHDHEEFVNLFERTGFEITSAETMYRGYSDRVTAIKEFRDLNRKYGD